MAWFTCKQAERHNMACDGATCHTLCYGDRQCRILSAGQFQTECMLTQATSPTSHCVQDALAGAVSCGTAAVTSPLLSAVMPLLPTQHSSILVSSVGIVCDACAHPQEPFVIIMLIQPTDAHLVEAVVDLCSQLVLPLLT